MKYFNSHPSALWVLQLGHSLPLKPLLSTSPCPSGLWDNSPFLPQTHPFLALSPGRCLLPGWPFLLSLSAQQGLAEGDHRNPLTSWWPHRDLWKQMCSGPDAADNKGRVTVAHGHQHAPGIWCREGRGMVTFQQASRK